MFSIKGLLTSVLSISKRLNALKLRIKGSTEEEEAYNRIISGRSWDEFCDTLKAAGGSIMGMDAPKDPLTQAEGAVNTNIARDLPRFLHPIEAIAKITILAVLK